MIDRASRGTSIDSFSLTSKPGKRGLRPTEPFLTLLPYPEQATHNPTPPSDLQLAKNPPNTKPTKIKPLFNNPCDRSPSHSNPGLIVPAILAESTKRNRQQGGSGESASTENVMEK